MASLERQRQDEQWKSQAELTKLILQFIAAGNYDNRSFWKIYDDIVEANLNFDTLTLYYVRHHLQRISSWIATEECLDSLCSFADTMSQIIVHWQHRADGRNPTRYAIKFHKGPVTATLLQIFALFPENYQRYIMIIDDERSEGGASSWLSEEIMDVLVFLSHQQDQPIVFGRGLASMAREDLDMMAKDTLAKDSYLEHLVDEMRKGEPDWNPGQVYTFPPSTEKIVFFWNHTQIHWTLLSTEIDEEQWALEHYNPLVALSTSHTSARDATTALFTLVQGASGFPKPKQVDIREEPSAQQDNTYDCGIITVYNAIEILNGRTPAKEVDAIELRQNYLSLILAWLDTNSLADNDGNNTPESSVAASPTVDPDNRTEVPATNSAIEEADNDNTSGFSSANLTIDFTTSSDDEDDDYSNMPKLSTTSPPGDPSQPSLNKDSDDSSRSNPSSSQSLSKDSDTDNKNHNNSSSSPHSPLSRIPYHYEHSVDREQPLSGIFIMLDRHESDEDGDDELSDLSDSDGNQC